jgi:two-component system aerobic respiration control protein ArcA
MAKKRINTKDLVDKIEKITKDRLLKEEVVSLKDFRDLKRKEDPSSILVIDDDETIRASLKRILEAEGYRVLLAADGTQLSSVLDDSGLDLIILDIGLPWINGFELAKLMKESTDLKSIPLIFVSGKTSELDVRRGFDVGADDFIKKPYEVEEIRKAVRTLLTLRGKPNT